jgi:hypothetical protein
MKKNDKSRPFSFIPSAISLPVYPQPGALGVSPILHDLQSELINVCRSIMQCGKTKPWTEPSSMTYEKKNWHISTLVIPNCRVRHWFARDCLKIKWLPKSILVIFYWFPHLELPHAAAVWGEIPKFRHTSIPIYTLWQSNKALETSTFVDCVCFKLDTNFRI